jgi:predicted NBD/HSP70 family sugar kinase
MGVNRTTVGSLVTDLASRGLVEERLPPDNPGPGRPSPLVGPQIDGLAVLAAEIATDSLAVAVVGLGGTIVVSQRVSRPRGFRPATDEIAQLGRLVRGCMAEVGADQRFFAAGISIPGLVRRPDGFVRLAPNLGWRDLPLADLVSQELGLDMPVLVGNDADLAALAEHTRGAGVGQADFICLWGEAGIGAGIIAGGRQLAGRDGYAGEVGHVTVNPDGRPCRCGSRGCWETEVGEEALLRGEGEALGREWTCMDSLLQAAAEGAPAATATLDRAGRWLGIGIAGLIDIFNPGALALGGVYARLYPYVRSAILAEVARRTVGTSQGPVDIGPVVLGDDGALLGAAELAFAPAIEDPTAVPRREARQPRPQPARTAVGRHTAAQQQGGEAEAQRTA